DQAAEPFVLAARLAQQRHLRREPDVVRAELVVLPDGAGVLPGPRERPLDGRRRLERERAGRPEERLVLREQDDEGGDEEDREEEVVPDPFPEAAGHELEG